MKKAKERGQNLNDIGIKMNIIPSSYKGTSGYLRGRIQDALAIMRSFRCKPDLFITMTANTGWKEIAEAIKNYPYCTAKDRDDIVARVFNAKLKQLLSDLLDKDCLGRIIANVYVIEFQKRGLPHAHILLILHPDCKLNNNPELFDQIVCAEIPDPQKYPKLHELVMKHMIHGPCKFYKNCLRDGFCTKGFPKAFCNETSTGSNGFPEYRRRSPENGGFTGKKECYKDAIIDNQWVVPYNPGLLLKYNCHLNVEVCATIASIKYLYKYIYKGNDKAFISIKNANDLVQHCDDFIKCRYFGPAEASWRIFGFHLDSQIPSCEALPCHLPEKNMVIFSGNNDDNNDNNNNNNNNNEEKYTTKLTQFFENNQKEINEPLAPAVLGKFRDGTLRPNAYDLLYIEYPQFYTWSKKKWHRRAADRNLPPKISRIHWVNYKEQERFFLRMLLLNRRGPTSYEHLKTVDNEECKTFREACSKLQLLDDDTEWINCMQEACAIITSGYQLRQLFATLLNNNEICDVFALWDKFKEELTEDLRHKYYTDLGISSRNQPHNDTIFNEGLFQIEELLFETEEHEPTLASYGLPTPLQENRMNRVNMSKDIRKETRFDAKKEKKKLEAKKKLFNKEQRYAFEQIEQSMYPQNGNEAKNNFFFIQANAGTGKTFVLSGLASLARSKKHIALCCATSGIAANLFINGRTMHSRFKIPLNVTPNSKLTIKKQSIHAELIRQSRIIIWDEAPMANSSILRWLDCQLKDIMGNEELFGGKTIVLSGDFKQIPPVIPKASTTVIINSSIAKCELFKHATKLKLVRNERLRTKLREQNLSDEMKQKLKKFDLWMNNIGNDKCKKYTDIHSHAVEIPKEYISTKTELTTFIDEIYDNIDEHNRDSNYYMNKCILTPKNKDVDEINEICLDKITDEEEKVYTSNDSVGLDDCSQLFSQEFLNAKEFPGIPKHKLRLKTNIPIILLRNIDPDRGLCNGTRLIVKELHKHFIIGGKLTNPEKDIIIPRMNLSPSGLNLGYEFRRKQFPVRIAFAITINKSQGQTMNETGIYLKEPVFSHGQLYVAISRVTNPEHLKIFIKQSNFHGFYQKHNKYLTRNIVYKQLLL